jgi:hypothetical protein
MTEISEDLLYFNGIDGATGGYALPPMTSKQLSDGILGVLPDDEIKNLNNWWQNRGQANYGLMEGYDPQKLQEAGWGIIFPAKTDPAIVDALKPLMEWRKQQAGERYKEYTGGSAGVRPNDTKSSWLARQGLPNFGPVNSELVPYYLLLVGSPTEIDYRFQTLLDVQYAVGRIAFDTPAEYASYAQSVVEAEKKQLQLQRKMTFFGVANPDDPATNLSAQHLIQPLLEYLSEEKLKGQAPWQVDAVVRDDALKQRLSGLLGGPQTPALLFTASHGMSFPMGDPRQFRHQGALLCQDWNGPRVWKQPIPEDFYFSADDLASDARVWGTIAFLFACYGAGTPQYDEFSKQILKDKRVQIAPNAFLSRLPQRMLAHPKGGALAVIGHVERAWGYSFVWGKGRSLNAFQSTLKALLSGAPIGYAFEVFNERYGEFSTDLTQTIDDGQWTPVDPNELAGKWTANNDSKNYVILGDPAVRVMVEPKASKGKPGKTVDRPSIDLSGLAAGGGAGFTAQPALIDPAEKAQPAASVATGGVVVAAQEYGLIDDLKAGASSVGSSLQQFSQKLGAFLSDAISNAATLEVSTYTSTAMEKVSIQGTKITGADLRARTALSIDGDTSQVVPINEDGAVDTALWAVHLEMVKQAQESRAELIKSAISAVASLANIGGLK